MKLFYVAVFCLALSGCNASCVGASSVLTNEIPATANTVVTENSSVTASDQLTENTVVTENSSVDDEGFGVLEFFGDVASFIYGIIYIIGTPVVALIEAVD